VHAGKFGRPPTHRFVRRTASIAAVIALLATERKDRDAATLGQALRPLTDAEFMYERTICPTSSMRSSAAQGRKFVTSTSSPKSDRRACG
jgi:hypothetical protein